jgi:dUTP pyrophosphatase
MAHLKIKKVHPDAKVPTFANPGDAGLDLYATERVVIRPGKMAFISTGIAVQLPRGTVGLIWDKSGLATKHGLKVMAGVIDEGYRGELKMCLFNLGKTSVTLEAGDKVSQMLVQPVHRPTIRIVQELSSSRRGDKGFGSSGKA